MDYVKIITMVINFFSRKAVHEDLINRTEKLEEFIDNVEKIKSENRESIKKLNLEDLRLDFQTKALIGVPSATFDDLRKLIKYFDSKVFLYDYKIFVRYRKCFLIEEDSQGNAVKIHLNEKFFKKTNRELVGVTVFFVIIAVVTAMTGRELAQSLVTSWMVPQILAYMFFLVVTILMIFFSALVFNDLNDLKLFIRTHIS
ncbi:hypothetical protein [Acinetobacter nectaris]|uniref:hypothetical protein n=1 Tax=Acinetobacter nectaris TaxID=1219382 RepID=UPI001F233B57|nr:hypothetical protein [Acinetobacter nectaris]MCF9045986.1 hypothetical protein [Acinetobacter nectaris]